MVSSSSDNGPASSPAAGLHAAQKRPIQAVQTLASHIPGTVYSQPTDIRELQFGNVCSCGQTFAGPTRHDVHIAWATHVGHSLLNTIPSFQDKAVRWMSECFEDDDQAFTQRERANRFLEEAFELYQAVIMNETDKFGQGDHLPEVRRLIQEQQAYALSMIDKTRDYVFGREVGEPSQEIGGVMVTLALLANSLFLEATTAAETELARVNNPELMAKIRAKNVTKRLEGLE